MPQSTPPPIGARLSTDGGAERLEGGHDPASPAFEGWAHRGDYFDLKKAKLRDQTAEKVGPEGLASNVLAGVVARVNGFTVPPRKELWEMIAMNGGLFEQYPHPSVTHIIVMELPDSKVQQWLRQPEKNRTPHVLPTFIVDSIERQQLQPWQGYLLPRLRAVGQRTMFELRPAARPAAAAAAGPVAGSAAAASPAGNSHISPNAAIASPPAAAAADPPASTGPPRPTARLSGASSDRDLDAGAAQSTRTDPDFVRKYFKRSRLHHIGTSRGKYQKYVADICHQPMSQSFAGADSEQTRVIMHIDMDCFFASVTMRTRPELKDKPFVVCFAAAGSDRPVGEISSASYPA